MAKDPDEAQPPLDETAAMDAPLDETPEPERAAAPDATSVMPAVEEPETPRWSARASVPTPSAPQALPPEYEEEWAGPPPRGFLVPILVTVCVLLLIALVGLGAWLISRGGQDEPGPTVTTTRATATTRPPTTPPTRPTTAQTTQPQQVQVPPVRNQPADAAQRTLQDAGLNPVLVLRPDTEVPAGRAIGTDPAAGSQVAPDSDVRLFISTGPPTPVETEPPTSPPAS